MAERVFLLPDPGEGLAEAEVVSWLVSEGDRVALNQPLAEVETAKAVVEIPSPFAGVVLRLHAAAGESLAVGAALVTFSVDAADGGGVDPDRGEPAAEDVGRTSYPALAAERDRRAAGVPSTPKVRRLAKDLGLGIETVEGTGPDGRITAEDVRRTAERGWAVTLSEDLRTDVRPVGAIRHAVAENLARQAAIPQVTTFRTVDCTALDAFRREMGVSPLPVVAAALCETAQHHPAINAAWAGENILVHGKVNIGIATETEHGLVVPVVRDAGRRGIGGIAAEIRRQAEMARSGTLTPSDTVNATIGISNTGSYGSEAGTPILTPGSAVTIAIGVIAPRALVVDGEVVPRPACTLSLTFDHRVMDGAAAGRALTHLVELLQNGERLRDLPR